MAEHDEWVEDALGEKLYGGEEIVEIEELESGMMSELVVVATTDRGFVVRNKRLGSPDVWPFELQVPAGSRNGGGRPEETTTEPLPEGVETQPSDAETRETEAAEPEEPTVVEETEPPEPADEDEGPVTDGTDLTILSGIGSARAETLAEADVTSLADLARADTEELAETLQVSTERVEDWQAEVDLTGIHGIGPARAEGLREAGLHTLEDLAAAHPRAVAEELDVPTGTVQSWQQEALGDSAAVEDFTEVKGIGDKRAKQIAVLGLTTLRELVEADPEALAEELGVGTDTVVTWQKRAVEAPSGPNDLLEVSGIGPSRARDLIRLGLPDRESFASANAAKIAEALEVRESSVTDWQDSAEDA